MLFLALRERPQGLKPYIYEVLGGTTEVVPFPKTDS